MGDVPPPRWRHTATLLPDLVRSAPPSLRRRDAPTQPRSLLHLCSPAGVAHVTGQHHDVRWALQGQACRRPHSPHPRLLPALITFSAPATTPAPAHPHSRAYLARSLRFAFRRYNDVHVLSVEKNEWSIKECAGSLPQPRSRARKSRCRPAVASSGAAWLPPRSPEPAPSPLPTRCPPGFGLRPRRATTLSRGGRRASSCATHAPSTPPSTPPSATPRPFLSAATTRPLPSWRRQRTSSRSPATRCSSWAATAGWAPRATSSWTCTSSRSTPGLGRRCLPIPHCLSCAPDTDPGLELPPANGPATQPRGTATMANPNQQCARAEAPLILLF